jgi:acetolactate synthase-1/2/3 large subunit
MHDESAPRQLWATVVEELLHWDVTTVFAVPGDDMLALGALRHSGIDVVLNRTQHMAVLMAAGRSLLTQTPAVALVGRGPGAAAAVPAVLEAAALGARVVLLSGGVPLGANRTTTFQFVPQLELMRPACRVASRSETGDDLAFRLAQAFMVADSPEGGVAYVEIPDPGTATLMPPSGAPDRAMHVAGEGWITAPDVVRHARRPVLVVGGGCRRLPRRAIEEWAERSGAAILVTASGRGIVSESDERYLGLSGLYANPAAAALLSRADLIIALGSRLEETAVVGWPDGVPCVHVDLDPQSCDPLRPGAFVRADVAHVMSWATSMVAEPSWAAEIASAREAAEKWAQQHVVLNPVASAVSVAVSALPTGSTLCHENGLMDIWSYLHPVTVVPDGVSVIVPSELTTLGTGCAAAFGARDIAGERGGIVLVITGDGAADTVRDEVAHLAPRGSGVVMLVLDNGGFGWLERQNREVNADAGVFTPQAPTRNDLAGAYEHQIVQAIAEVQRGEIRTVRVLCDVSDEPPLDFGAA